jgi:flagellar FliJ protein
MPRAFRFRLEQVLRYRKQIEDTKKKEFALARRRVTEQRKKLFGLIAEEARQKEELKGLEKGSIDITSLRLQLAYLNTIARMITYEKQELTRLIQIEADKRDQWSQASKAVRVLERLKERLQQRYMYELSREEQKFLDEVAQTGFIRGAIS